jgi:hypothetical protein
VDLAVEGETAAGNPVAVATDQRAEVRAVRQVRRQRVEAQHHVARRASPVRHVQRRDHAAEIADGGHHAGAVVQREQAGGAPVRQLSERRADNRRAAGRQAMAFLAAACLLCHGVRLPLFF